MTDDEMDDGPGSIKARLADAEGGLRPSISPARTVQYTAGTVRLPSGANLAIAAGAIVVPDNATSFVWVDSTGTVATGAIPPVVRVLICSATVVSNTITNLVDLRAIGVRSVAPVSSAIRVFGGINGTDITATNGQVFDQGNYYCRNLTIPAGVSVTVSRFARFWVSGNTSIQGSITVTPATSGGVGAIDTTGVFFGGIPGAGIGGGAGFGLSSNTYNFAAQPYGSGGGLGGTHNGSNARVSQGNGGSGGGGLWIESAGPITVGTSSTITAAGSSAGVNTLITQFATGWNVTGAGGGSGGLVYLASLTSVTVSGGATVDVRGGAGGAKIGVSSAGWGGGGGGGGWVVLSSPSNNTSGANILLSGGLGSVGDGTGNLSGGGGSFGGQGGSLSTTINGAIGQLLLLSYTPNG
jgi:hypothetical protein